MKFHGWTRLPVLQDFSLTQSFQAGLLAAPQSMGKEGTHPQVTWLGSSRAVLGPWQPKWPLCGLPNSAPWCTVVLFPASYETAWNQRAGPLWSITPVSPTALNAGGEKFPYSLTIEQLIFFNLWQMKQFEIMVGDFEQSSILLVCFLTGSRYIAMDVLKLTI